MRHTTTRTSTISRPQLVLRHTRTHTPTDIHTRTHTHSKTIECSPTLTHETEQLATKKHLHYHTLVDSQVLKPTLSLECSPLTNASLHGEKLLSCAPPIGPMSVQTSFEPAADTAVRSESRQTWTERKVEQQVKGLGGGGWWWCGRGAEFAGTDGGMKQAKEGVAGRAHHSQTRPRIPEGWGTAPAPLLPLPATRAVLPP